MTGQTNDTTYVALIGDIRGSRDLDNRREAQEEFKSVVEGLNDQIPDRAIASPFTVTTGDEFQGLLTSITDAVDAAVSATDELHPTKIRFGIGRGGLETEVNHDQAIGMDGPCFYRAREAIEAADDEAAWIRVRGWSDDLEGHVDSLFDLVQCVREGWTDRQAQFARTLAREGSQKQVANTFDVSKSTVSESLSAGHVQEVRAAEASLAALLESSAGPGESR